MSLNIEKKALNVGGDIAHFAANADDPYMVNFHGRQKEVDALELIISQYMNDDAIALDIGANIGVTSVSMARLFKYGTVHSFEPSESNYEYLCQNLHENGIENCTPYQIAIGDREGEDEFLHHKHGAGSHVVTDAHIVHDNMGAMSANSTYTVRKDSIDNILRKKDLDVLNFIKIDVEGLELDVLKGMAWTIERYNPYIYLEFNSWTLIAFQNINPRDFIQFLASEFEYLYKISKDSTLHRLEGSADWLSFLHENLVNNGCVDDLLLRKRGGVVSSSDFLTKILS